MKYKSNLVSILLPVHNGGATLSACMDSLLNQTHSELEIIAIDDYSRDNSYQILKEYKKRDQRLRIYRNVKHYGAAITLNRCLRRARGQFVSIMDARDVSLPSRIKKQLAFLENNPKTVAVGTQCVFTNQENKKTVRSEFPLAHTTIYNRLINGVTMQFETALINRFRLPKDLLYFSHSKNQLHLSDLFVKLQRYGLLANLNQHLYKRYKASQSSYMALKTHYLPHLLLFLKARFEHDYRPSLDFFLSPIIKQFNLR